ncbi:glycosyltransferase family 9 protein [Deferrisoma palaeochoriense]
METLLCGHRDGTSRAPGAGLLVYHQGGLGDFVLSVPAILRLAAWAGGPRAFWGPSDRLALLPGFGPAPGELLRRGHELFGEAPSETVRGALGRFGWVAGFGGRAPPRWLRHAGDRALGVASFPPPGGPWVPRFQALQLDRAGVPRPPGPLLRAWRRAVLPAREPRWIAVHAGSGDPKKNFPPAFWAEACGALGRALGLPVRVILGPAEAERGAPGWEAVGPVTVCGAVPELLGILAGAALYLGNDAGPTHLAAALGVPTVAAFGPTNPGLWRPLGPRVRVVRTGASCAPCTAGGPIGCPDPRCLGELDPGLVVQAGLALASGGSTTPM